MSVQMEHDNSFSRSRGCSVDAGAAVGDIWILGELGREGAGDCGISLVYDH